MVKIYLTVVLLAIFAFSLLLLFVAYTQGLPISLSGKFIELGWSGVAFISLSLLLLICSRFVSVIVSAICSKILEAGAYAPKNVDGQRRRFLSQSAHIGMVFLAGGLTAKGLHNATRSPVTTSVVLPVRKLHKDLYGFRIAQLTDLHANAFTDRGWMQEIVDITNHMHPDIIAITGDMVDAPVDRMIDIVSPLADLNAKHGCYFVTGNHEYYIGARNVETWLTQIRQLGVDVLMNEHRTITIGNSSILIGGVTDYEAGYALPEHASSPSKALSGLRSVNFKMLLAHQPKSIYQAAEAGFDFQLSGHTHGGQMFPGHLMMGLIQPFLYGMHQYGQTAIYVSSGAGYWGPNIRLGSISEIPIIDLIST